MDEHIYFSYKHHLYKNQINNHTLIQECGEVRQTSYLGW